MKGFATNDQADYYSWITSITVNGKKAYELKGKFLDDLHNKAFSEERKNVNEEEERCEEFNDHEQPVCNIRRFEMIKYSFGQGEEYVAIKEDEYEDLTRISEDTCQAYQEIFRMMGEGWMATRME
ncbi:hypothetical protein Tco_1419077 [Tanacetum coccineum]